MNAWMTRIRYVFAVALLLGVTPIAARASGEAKPSKTSKASKASKTPMAVASDGELSVGTVYGRFASLKEAGFKELACGLEPTVKRYERKKTGDAASGDAAAASASSESINEALKNATFTLAMRPGECAVTASPRSTAKPDASAERWQRSVAEALQVACAKMSLHYFRHPLSDYGKEHRLVAQGGWYRLDFGSGDYKLAAFLSPDLRTMREYSDGKDNQTDISFRQEGDKLAPASIVARTPTKTAKLDSFAYELKKGFPILSALRATFEDSELAEEIQAKLSACKTPLN